MATTTCPPRRDPARSVFVTTRWSVVLAAQDESTTAASEALEQLCRAYWYPLYAYARRLGRSPEDAQDLTQEFFHRLLAKDYLAAVRQERGRFRTFLMTAFRRFLANDWDRSRAAKRGGGKALISLDTSTAETRYHIEPVDGMTPERIYERRWALTLLEQVIARLGMEAKAVGKAAEFETLRACLTADKASLSYAQWASQLDLSEGAVRVAVHRLRRRFREVFREEIAQTVATPDDIEDEIRHLLTVLGG